MGVTNGGRRGGGAATLDPDVLRRIPLRPSAGLILPPGVRVRGANITVKPGSDGWPDLFEEWDWAGWVKPQVDRALSVGANCIRLLSAAGAVVQPAFGLSRATHLARWTQLLDYLADRGCYAYPCGGGVMGVNTLVSTDEEIAALAEHVAQWPNVIGFDVWNEGEGATQAQLQAAGALVRAAAPGLPITYSANGITSSAEWAGLVASAPFLAAVADADFLDVHIYYDVQVADFNAAFAVSPKQLLIGEFGGHQGLSGPDRVARYNSVRRALARPDIIGAMAWAMADQHASDATLQYGLFDNAGVERADMSLYFRTMPRIVNEGRILNQPAAGVVIDTGNGVYKTVITYTFRPGVPMRLVARANANIITTNADQRFLARIVVNGVASQLGVLDIDAVSQDVISMQTGTFYIPTGADTVVTLEVTRELGTAGGTVAAQSNMELLLEAV